MLLEEEAISEDCVLFVDEVYLQKPLQFHIGKFIGGNKKGKSLQGIVVFMRVSLK